MNDLVNHPEHYQGKVECIDCIESANDVAELEEILHRHARKEW